MIRALLQSVLGTRSGTRPSLLLPGALLAAVTLGGEFAGAQSFVDNTTPIPQGSPDNNSTTENVEFGDVDLDGDWDALFADGGDCCNDRNRIWMNRGGDQGGPLGWFQDETTTRLPTVQDSSRDVELVDYDSDGDLDAYVANSSTHANQPSRFWTNLGGQQGGSLGFYQDETASRWIDIAGPGSSVANSAAHALGGFIDWSGDGEFADLDNDGDLDLVHSSYGNLFGGAVPTRMFLNDGAGYFTEFNPSGFQLSGTDMVDGTPGLWAEGTQQTGTLDTTGQFCDIAESSNSVDLGDVDGDFDIDLVLGSRFKVCRLFENRLEENGGTLGFRDVTHAKFTVVSQGEGNYDQQLGDLDNDGDLDLWAGNWDAFCDFTMMNDGGGLFTPTPTLAGSCGRQFEMDFIDYDNDGDLDSIVSNSNGKDFLYRNDSAVFTQVAAELPNSSNLESYEVDPCDVDADGDMDLFITTKTRNIFLENITQVVDTHAPRVAQLEDAPDRVASVAPTVIRAQVYDNATALITAHNSTWLEVEVDGGPSQVFPMTYSGGQVFRGEVPGSFEGAVSYRAYSQDENGNLGVSASASYLAQPGPCAAGIQVYCTAKVNSQGCLPSITMEGCPSMTDPGPAPVFATQVVNNKNGNLFFGFAPKGLPFQGGFLCVQPPSKRTPVQGSGGNPPPNDCSGVFTFDFNGRIQSGSDPTLQAGVTVYAQYWSRDPLSPSTTGLTDAVSFTIQP